jgi:hypothetical protein
MNYLAWIIVAPVVGDKCKIYIHHIQIYKMTDEKKNNLFRIYLEFITSEVYTNLHTLCVLV